ncbi:MAG: hypothetical protein LBF04_01200 [Prevotellaceae bacterium]|jgi:hypothetical protein|nr:hypothetical protein [Prevotellaceae bacterium]
MKIYLLFIPVIIFCHSASAQNNTLPKPQTDTCLQLLKQAKQLHKEYRFAEAAAICKSIINSHEVTSNILDSARLQLIICENSRNLVNYTFEPAITGKQKVELSNFINSYDSLENGYFAPAAKSMLMDADSGKQNLPLTFYPEHNSKNANVIYFSSYGRHGQNGLDIYKIHRINDTVWSEPELLDSTVNTQFDEIYPYLSEDGKMLYFTSNGHYGMGGFDLFKCTFDEKKGTWKQAENLGFPFSSPYDDFLYIPDNNSDFACFGSTRNCDNESIYVYKTEIVINPDYKAIEDYELLQQIANLDISVDNDRENEDIEVNIEILKANEDYIKMLKAARYYNNRFDEIQKSLDSLREKIHNTETPERQNIEKQILDKENELFDMQYAVSRLSIYISKSEYDFITEGIQPALNDELKSITDIQYPAKKTITDSLKTFDKTYNNIRLTPDIKIINPQPTEDDLFNFTVNEKSIILHDYVLPDGLVYRIQIISTPTDKKVDTGFFKNCSPVTTELYKNNRRYYIGLFKNHSDAEIAVKQLKTIGFKDIFISAWSNRETVTLREAKNMELKQKQSAAQTEANKIYRITIGPIDKEKPVIQLINEYANGKDVSKIINSDSKIVYYIGNFTTFEQAINLREKLIDNAITDVNINEITTDNQIK